ncbi:MAG TPA: WGR domain-containing protein [Candidatus Angelobacter sp.]
MQPSILRAFGWRFALVLTKDWYHSPDDVVSRLEKILHGQEVADEPELQEEEAAEPTAPAPQEKAATTGSIPLLPTHPASAAEEKNTVEPPPVPTSVSTPGAVRHFEFVGGSSQKYWEISLSGNSFTVRFGRIGTVGQSQTKTFADEARAKREADHLIAEKLRKGYVEEGG